MKKLLLFILTVSLTLGFVRSDGLGKSLAGATGAITKDRYTFLVCGIDDAAENTDAIILFDYDTVSNAASFVQIPRDTYLRSSIGTDKINSIYPSLRARGINEKDAMASLTGEISSTLGVPIDGYICYTVKALAGLIDAVGGVEIDLPTDFSFADGDGSNKMELSAGRHLLSGADAVKFIRYRKGYALGDLGRVDAQKFFLSAFVRRLKSSVNLKVVTKAAFSSNEGIITNIKILDILGIALKIRGRLSTADVKYANLPGEARLLENGRWYYLINKNAAVSLFDTLGLAAADFDREHNLLNSTSDELGNIYYNENIGCKIYDDDTLNDLTVK